MGEVAGIDLDSGQQVWVQGEEDISPLDSALAARMEQFIVDNDIDERAAGLLRTLEPHKAQAVMDLGRLRKSDNPSATVMARMKQVEREDKQERKSNELVSPWSGQGRGFGKADGKGKQRMMLGPWAMKGSAPYY